jgi:hypothetical protein
MMHPVRARSFFSFAAAALAAAGYAGCSEPAHRTGATEPAASPAQGTTPAPTAGAGSFAAQRTGPIAPACSEAFCADVDVAATLSCTDRVSGSTFTMSTRVVGRTTQVSCAVDASPSGGLDLRLVAAPENAEGDMSELGFKLRNYTGPGTYPLVNLEEEGDHLGLNVRGNVPRAPGESGNAAQNVGSASCRPSACQAIVAEGSEPIPTDEYSTHEFRVRAEVRCPAGSTLGGLGCGDDETVSCTFDRTPTLLVDFACRN